MRAFFLALLGACATPDSGFTLEVTSSGGGAVDAFEVRVAGGPERFPSHQATTVSRTYEGYGSILVLEIVLEEWTGDVMRALHPFRAAACSSYSRGSGQCDPEGITLERFHVGMSDGTISRFGGYCEAGDFAIEYRN